MYRLIIGTEAPVENTSHEALMAIRAERGHVGRIVQIDAEGVEIVRAAPDDTPPMSEDDRLRSLGFAIPRLALMDYHNGDPSQFRRSRLSWEALAAPQDALRDVYNAVQAEGRTDHLCSVADLRMDDDGLIDVAGVGKFPLEHRPLSQLLARCGTFPRGASLMAALDPDVRAYVFNKQITKADPRQDVRLRTRTAGTGAARSLFACMSPGYGVFDADQMAILLAQKVGALDDDLRGEAHYDPKTTAFRFNVSHHKGLDVNVQAGDVFRLGYRFRSNDAGGGSIIGSRYAERPVCLNMAIINTEEVQTLHARHTGRMRHVAEAVEAMLNVEADVLAGFAGAWGILRDTDATAIFAGESTEDRIAEIADLTGDVGVQRDALVEILLGGFADEPGDTVADLVNAVTRAHTNEALDRLQMQAIEERAGELVPILARRCAEA